MYFMAFRVRSRYCFGASLSKSPSDSGEGVAWTSSSIALSSEEPYTVIVSLKLGPQSERPLKDPNVSDHI